MVSVRRWDRLIQALPESRGAKLADDARIRAALARIDRASFIHSIFVPDSGGASWREITWSPGEVPDRVRQHIYSNAALVTAVKGSVPTSSSTSPGLMADMLQAVDPHPGSHILEIGTGTGYNAALLAELVGPEGIVTSVEVEAAVAQRAREDLDAIGIHNVRVIQADGRTLGGVLGPVDGIVVTASAGGVHKAWSRVARTGARLVLPRRIGAWSPVSRLERAAGSSNWVWSGRYVSGAAFMALRGAGEVLEPGEITVRATEPAQVTDLGVGPRSYEGFEVFLGLSAPEWRRIRIKLPDGRSVAGLGAGSGTGTVLVAAGRMYVDGVDEANHCQLVRACVDQWRSLGRPDVSCYRSWVGSDMPPALRVGGSGPPWVISCADYSEVVELVSPAGGDGHRGKH